MLNISSRPPQTVVRQFSRAVFADRLIGDELMRLTLARVSIDPASSSASVVDVMAAFMQSWRQALSERGAQPQLFSDEALLHALPAMPGDDRLLLLLVDGLGLSPAQAADVIGLNESVGPLLKQARNELRLERPACALVIEDEPLIAADITSILERLGITILAHATDKASTMDAAAQHVPDIVLADYHLEGGDSGVEAILGVQERHDCPIVFITGYPDRVLQGSEIEPDFVISKPYTPHNVRTAVVHCLDARRA